LFEKVNCTSGMDDTKAKHFFIHLFTRLFVINISLKPKCIIVVIHSQSHCVAFTKSLFYFETPDRMSDVTLASLTLTRSEGFAARIAAVSDAREAKPPRVSAPPQRRFSASLLRGLPS